MNDVGFRLLGVAHEMKRLMDDNLKAKGLSFSQIHVIGYLDGKRARGEVCNQLEIGRICCNVRPSSVSSLIKTLENQGYIVREAGKDARVKNVSLTEKGKRVARECKLFTEKIEENFTENFTEEERAAYLSFLIRSEENLRNPAITGKGQTEKNV